jgi:hypothetical protein
MAKYNKKGDKIIKIVGFLLLLIAVVILSMFIYRSFTNKIALSHEGAKVEGVIEAKDVDSAPRGGFTRRSINYSFTPTNSNKTINRNDVSVFKGEYDNYKNGDAISITYLESDTSVNEPTFALNNLSSNYFDIFMFAGLFGSFYGYNRLSKRYKVLDVRSYKGFKGVAASFIIVPVLIFGSIIFAAVIFSILNALLTTLL